MKRVIVPAVLAAIFALVVGPALRADEAKTYAVIVAVGQFEDKDIKPRPSAGPDAKAIYDVLTDKTVGGIDPAQVQVLVSGKDGVPNAKPATKANILAAFKELAAKATKEDKVFVYMVGQGAPSGDRTCIFAADSTVKDRAKDAISGAEIRPEFKALKSQNTCIMLDLNLKSFDAGKETVLEPNIMELVRGFLGLEEKDDAELPIGKAVILAGSGANPTVVTDKNQSIFATAVVAALRGDADKDGGEADGSVTVDELVKYLDSEIGNLARKFGTTREEKEQLPFVVARESHFALTRNPEVSAMVDARIKKFEEMTKDPKIGKDVAAEGRKLLSRAPKLLALQKLRSNYQELADGKLTIDQFLKARESILTAMKLDDAGAKMYAQKLMRALDRYKEQYIKELDLTELVVNGIRGLYRRADVPMSDELKDKLEKAKKLDKAELLSLLIEARLPLGKREDFDRDHDVEITIIESINKFVDPYTTYIDRERVDEMERDVTGTFTGIGVQIRRDLVRDGLLVVTPIKNSPAYKAGLKAGDLITSIKREVDSMGKRLNPPIVTSTKGMKVTDAVKLILGEPGTKVKVMVDREGAEPKEYELTRGLIETESVYGYKRKVDDSWDFYIDPKSKIAYIHLTQFARNSLFEMEKAVKQLEKDGVKGLILDLRFNPGGYLNVANDICDLFIDDGLIVSIRPRVEDEAQYFGKRNSVHKQRGKPDYPFASYTDFPMVCLINGGSASGSEILSACLQDHNRAVIMGERSFGKGSVQTIDKFEATGGEIKMTTATFWRPSGKNLNKLSTKGRDEDEWGVTPDKDFVIKLTRGERDQLSDKMREWGNIPNRELKAKEPAKEFKDRQLEAALEYLRGQIKVSSNVPMKKSATP